MFRKSPEQIKQDMDNQENARRTVELVLGVDVIPMEEFSIWDWEIKQYGDLVGIGEYRRRFVQFGTYPDFQFSKSKFVTMKQKADAESIRAWMFVEFDDGIKVFHIEGSPGSQIMQRRGEQRTQECVVIQNTQFLHLKDLSI